MRPDHEPIRRRFPELQPDQLQRLERFHQLLEDWNAKVNLVSRTDVANIARRHLLHSLAIAKLAAFEPGTRFLDVGTGGGLPGIPLAIALPQCRFHLVDSVGKKIRVVQDAIDTLELKNASAEQVRAERLGGPFDFVLARAVTQLPVFMSWVRKLVRRPGYNPIANGVLYLKGGDWQAEAKGLTETPQARPLEDLLPGAGFEDKVVLHIPIGRP